MGIRKKSFLIFSLLLVVFLSAFALNGYYLRKLTRQAKLTQFTWSMADDILQVRRHEKNFILRGDSIFRGNRTYADVLRSHLKHLYREIKQYKKIADDSYEIEKVDLILQKLRKYDVQVNEFIEAHKTVDSRLETENLISAGREIVDAVHGLKITASDELNSVLGTLKSIHNRQWLALFVLLIVILGFFWVMFSTLVLPVRKLQDLNRELAREGVIHEGQLKEVDELVKNIKTKDEVGQLARGYREMMIKCSNSYLSLQNKMKEIEQLYQLKSEFTSTVSHELRTPLTAIKEGINLVLDGSTGEINEEQQEFLGIAQRNVDRLARLINYVLDFSKLAANKVELRKKDININEVISSVIDIYRLVIEKKGLKLVCFLDSTRDLLVHHDPDRINQVLTNLLSNAVKFTESGTITVLTEKDDKTNSVHIAVKDTGEGIHRDNLCELFKPFSQVGKGKEKTGGTGLGLAICREIIEKSGGKIWVDSEQNMGSVFSVSLPIEERRKPVPGDCPE